jgi:hypothetical protein
MKHGLLEQLERRATALIDGQSFATVYFSNRTRRVMRLCDVIDLLQEGNHPSIVKVQGEPTKRDGHLLELIKTIVEDPAWTDTQA